MLHDSEAHFFTFWLMGCPNLTDLYSCVFHSSLRAQGQKGGNHHQEDLRAAPTPVAPVFLSHQGVPVHPWGPTGNLRHAWGLLLDFTFLLGDFFFFFPLY